MRYVTRQLLCRRRILLGLLAVWLRCLGHASPTGPAIIHAGNDAAGFAAVPHTVFAESAEEALTQYARLQAGGRTLTAGSSRTDTRVVVVNDIAGHFEVLAGVLFTLYRMRRGQQAAAAGSIRLARPRVLFTGNPRGPTLNGLMDWLGQDVGNDAEWHALGSGPGGAAAADAPRDRGAGSAAGVDGAWRTPADVVICVSAELAPKVCAAAVAGVQPQLLVVIVHRADTHTKNSKFLALHPQATRIMALAPHVANLSSHMLKRPVDWSMPVAPFAPAQPCRSKDCLQGFSIQGALRRYKSKHGNGFTRDYGALWARMLELRKQGVAVPPVVVVGKGERRHLMLPRELESSVTFHPWLKYQDFWMLIHRSYALVPAFGMPVYYESRISSTILASLITCVPVIAEQRLLDTYTFLSEEHVFLRQPDEDEAAAMARIAALPEQAIFAKREALCELRGQIDARVDHVLGGYLAEASKAR